MRSELHWDKALAHRSILAARMQTRSVVSIGRCLELQNIREDQPGRYRSNLVPGSIKFAFDPAKEPRFLVLPGLQANQDLIIFLCDVKGRSLEGRSIRWLQAPRVDGPAVVELESIINWWREPVSQITVQLTRTGEIALGAAPRLLR